MWILLFLSLLTIVNGDIFVHSQLNISVPLDYSESHNENNTILLQIDRYITHEENLILWIFPDLPYTKEFSDDDIHVFFQDVTYVNVYRLSYRGFNRNDYAHYIECDDFTDLSLYSNKSKWEKCIHYLDLKFRDTLQFYNTENIARDYLRAILKVKQEKPFPEMYALGFGYGTFVINALLELDDDIFTGIIYDGFNIKGHSFYNSIPMEKNHVFKTLMDICDKDSTCHYHLNAKSAYQVAMGLEDKFSQGDHCPEIYALFKNEMRQLTFFFSLLTQDYFLRAAVPVFVHRMDRCSERDVIWVTERFHMLYPSGNLPPNIYLKSYNFVYSTHITLSDLWKDTNQPDVSGVQFYTRLLSNSSLGPGYKYPVLYDLYPSWPKGKTQNPDHIRYFARTDIPILILYGDMNPFSLDVKDEFHRNHNYSFVKLINFPTSPRSTIYTSKMIHGDTTCALVLLKQFLSGISLEGLVLECLDDIFDTTVPTNTQVFLDFVGQDVWGDSPLETVLAFFITAGGFFLISFLILSIKAVKHTCSSKTEIFHTNYEKID